MTTIALNMVTNNVDEEQRRRTAEMLIDRTQTLSIAPPVAFQVFMLTRGPDYTCEALVDLVKLDPNLTAQILRLCNSAIFRGQGIASLRDAVIRIGNGAIAEMAMSLTVGKMLAVRKTAYCPDPNSLWRHAVQCALACRYLNGYCEESPWKPDVAFTAGLLHDLGKMVINAAPVADNARVITLMEDNGMTMADAELEALGADHAEIGGMILERWNLPVEISRGIRFHHAPEFDRSGFANLIHLGNECAKVTATTKSWDDFETAINPYAMQQLRLSPSKVKACWADVIHDVEAIERFMWS